MQNLRYEDAEQQLAGHFEIIASFSSTVENVASLDNHADMGALLVEQTHEEQCDGAIGQEATGKEQEREPTSEDRAREQHMQDTELVFDRPHDPQFMSP